MSRVFRRYLLFQLPDAAAGGLVVTLLVHFDVVSPRVGGLIFALWVLKELVLFPFVRSAYEQSSPHGTEALVGAEGVVTAALGEDGMAGFVRVGSELWRARPASETEPPPIGASIRVDAVEGYTLVVSPARRSG